MEETRAAELFRFATILQQWDVYIQNTCSPAHKGRCLPPLRTSFLGSASHTTCILDSNRTSAAIIANDAICIFSTTCRSNRQGGEFCHPPKLILHPIGLVQYALHVLHILHHIAICIYLQRLYPAFVVILQPTLSIPCSGFATSPQLSHLLDNIARHFTLDASGHLG